MRAKKRLGQHFLQPEWVHKLVAAIAPTPEDRFLEVGPGPGALTLRLAPLVSHLTAIEVDVEMVQALAPKLPPNVDLIEADFLDVDLARFVSQAPVRVVGNLPYNVSSPILFRLVEGYRQFGKMRDATLMLQREVAERLVAGPGTKDYGVLSIFIQRHADARIVLTLPPGAFRPAPKVHSAVVRLTFRPPKVAVRDEAVFVAMVRSMFTLRRKTLGNALKPFAETKGLLPAQALGAAGIDPMRRPETLQLEELSRLADVFVSTAG